MAQKLHKENSRVQQQTSLADVEADFNLPPSEMPPWFIVFYEQYVHQRLDMMNMIRSYAAQPSQVKEEIVMSGKPM
jgi:hypothetical protein